MPRKHTCISCATCAHLQGNISLEKSARQRPFDWLPEQGWEDVIKLTTVLPEAFGSLADDIERNEMSWKQVLYTLGGMYIPICSCSRWVNVNYASEQTAGTY